MNPRVISFLNNPFVAIVMFMTGSMLVAALIAGILHHVWTLLLNR